MLMLWITLLVNTNLMNVNAVSEYTLVILQ